MHPGRHAARNVRLLYAYWFLREFQLWIPVWIVYLTVEQGFSLTQVTLTESIYLIGVVLLEVPTGAVADRWGRSRSVGLGAIALAGATLIFAFTTSFPILLASFLLWSVASTLMSGADMALLFDSLKSDGREGAYERIAGRGAALNWIGVACAMALGGPVASATSIQFTIFVGSASCLVTAGIAFAMWEPPFREAPESAPSPARAVREGLAEVRRSPGLLRVIILAATTMAALEGGNYLIQPYLLDRGIEVGAAFSLLQVPLTIAGVAGSLAVARWGTSSGRALVQMVTLPLAGVVAYAALALGPGLSAYAALPLLSALGAYLYPAATGYLNRRIGSERRATILSMQGMVLSLTLAVVTPLLGFITDQWGLAQAYATCGVLALIAVVVFGLPSLRSSGILAQPARSGS